MNKLTYTLITGASGGIGKEFAGIAASYGMNLILTARNIRSLEALKTEIEDQYNVKVILFICDLAESGAVNNIITFLETNDLDIDILINNAGFGLYGAFNQTASGKEDDMIRVNIMALTQLTKYAYTKMVSEGRGRILNVSSLAGFMPGPLMSVYYASKSYVLSFSQALANEAKATGVSITVLCPGPTESGFLDNASLGTSMLFKSFGKIPEAKEVALFGFKKMLQGKTLAIHGAGNRLMIFLIRFMPRKWVVSIVRYIQRESKK